MSSVAARFGLVCVLVTASAVSTLQIDRHARSQWGGQQELLWKQSGKLAELVAKNRQLSTFPAQPTNSTLSRDQFMELMRLRGEIGLLRKSASEAAALGVVHRELLAALKGRELPEGRPVLAHWSKAQLSPAGYAEPVTALQTGLWAMTRNGTNALLASVTPNIEWVLTNNPFAGDNVGERISEQTKDLADSLSPADGFYLVGQELNSPDRVSLEVYFEPEGATRWFRLMEIGGEWKMQAILLPMGDGGKPGAQAWPSMGTPLPSQ
jgi:hypothetical protein